MKGIEIVETRPIKIEKPVILIGIPDVGLVGVIASGHLIDSYKMENVGYIESIMIPPIIFLHGSGIFDPVRIYEKNSVILVTSEVPIPAEAIYPFANNITEWLEKKKPRMVLLLGGIPIPNRIDVDKPECYTITTNKEAADFVQQAILNKLDEGIVVGPYARILRECQKKGISTAAILSQSFDKYPDPGAAASVIEVVGKLLNIDVDTATLLKTAEETRIKTRELMRSTQKTMRKMGKARELEVPPMYV